jgi:hypothetical protein
MRTETAESHDIFMATDHEYWDRKPSLEENKGDMISLAILTNQMEHPYCDRQPTN